MLLLSRVLALSSFAILSCSFCDDVALSLFEVFSLSMPLSVGSLFVGGSDVSVRM